MASGFKEQRKSAFAVSLFKGKGRRPVVADVNLLPDKDFHFTKDISSISRKPEEFENPVQLNTKSDRRSSLPGIGLPSLGTAEPTKGGKAQKEKVVITPPIQRVMKRTLKSEPRVNPLRRSLKRKFRSRSEKSLNASVENDKATGQVMVEKVKFGSESSLLPKRSKMPELENRETNNAEVVTSPTEARPATVMFSSDGNHDNSLEPNENGQKMLHWLINPVKDDKFFSDVWERKPLLIKRRDADYFKGWFTTKDLDNILHQNHLKFTENIDITQYVDGKRKTLNPSGQAHSSVVWEYFKKGCSVRLLNPQSYSEPVWKLNATLQEFFGCYVGANMYLTPPGSQGFAPHYDDIEAFIMQLEGKKNWKLYSPRTLEEQLPRYSSENLKEEELDEPILNCVLEAGDVLYFPRGTIHQASTPDDTHSLHITVSTYQQFSWGDYLELLMPRALEVAMEEDVDFRKGLPLHFLNNIGLAHSEKTHKERNDLLKRVLELMFKLTSYAPIDSAADQLAVNVVKNQQPPFLSEAVPSLNHHDHVIGLLFDFRKLSAVVLLEATGLEEKSCSIQGNGAFWDNARVCGEAHFQPITKVRLIRPGVARMAVSEEKAIVYYSVSNSRVYGQSNIQGIEFSIEDAEALEHVICSYPQYVTVESLPCSTYSKKVELIKALYDHGILRTQTPLLQDSAL